MQSNGARLAAQMPQEIDAALITSDLNRRYFTGFPSSAGYLLLLRDAQVLLVDFRYYERAKAVASGCTVELLTDAAAQLPALLKRCGVQTVAVEADALTVRAYRQLQARLQPVRLATDWDLSAEIARLRSVKTPEELSHISAAQRITEAAFAETLKTLHAGVTEREVVCTLEYNLKRNGADGLAFDTIAVSGKKSSLPHGVFSDKPLESGDFLTLDFGAVKDGYCSDMTRTVAIGEVSEKQRTVYRTVLEAQEKAFAEIRPGVRCCDVDRAARDWIERAGYKGCFGHGLGHSVGLYIHESPSFNTRDETPLRAGMVLTVEPGVYLEGEFGVRIEDMVVVTADGFQNLTKSPKNLIRL